MRAERCLVTESVAVCKTVTVVEYESVSLRDCGRSRLCDRHTERESRQAESMGKGATESVWGLEKEKSEMEGPGGRVALGCGAVGVLRQYKTEY